MKTKPITWHSRYSDTMDNDDMGRWARIATIGSNNIWENHKLANFELAWIKKLSFTHIDGHNVSGFTVTTYFPSPAIKPMYDTLEQAMNDVEEQFKWFMKNVVE